MSKRSGKQIKELVALRNKGVGWGVLAREAGVKPSDLNKLRVRIAKKGKIKAKRQTKQQKQLKQDAPKKGRKEKVLKKSGNKKPPRKPKR